MQSSLVTWCNRIIRSGYYLLFGLVPLLLTPLNYELFEYNKMMAVYAITALVAAAWLTKMFAGRKVQIVKTPLDIPIALFTLSQFVSALFSIDPHISWLGYYSRFNGGLWSIISYTTLYYGLLSNLDAFGQEAEVPPNAKRALPTTLPSIIPLLRVTLVTATAVAAYGILERMGIDKHLWVQDVQNRVFSTMGQPNWLAAYLVALIPVAMAFAYQGALATRWVSFAIPAALTLVFFLTLLFTKSRSGLLAFAVADVILWAFLLVRAARATKGGMIRAVRQKSFGVPLLIMHAALAIAVFFVGTGNPAVDAWITLDGWKTRTTHAQVKKEAAAPAAGPALEVGGTESGTIRKYVWQGAINAWNSSVKTKLIGTGTETFAFAFYRSRPVGHNLTSEWDFLYNKAHNEYLNFLATTGAFGLGSYIVVLAVFIVWFTRTYGLGKPAKNADDPLAEVLPYALFAGWVSLLITNFFGFSVVITQVFLFLFPAILFALAPSRVRAASYRQNMPAWLVWVPFVACAVILIRIGLFWYADTLYAKGYRLIRAGLYGQGVPSIALATGINPNEPMYQDELASGYATLAVAALESKNATQAAELAGRAIASSDRAVKSSPENVNFYKTRTKVFYTLSALDPKFNNDAINTLLAAVPLSPNDPKIYYNLAILVGREGDTDKAITYLMKSKELKRNYRDAYFALWVFYTELNKPREANAILTEYLTNIDPTDKDFQERLK